MGRVFLFAVMKLQNKGEICQNTAMRSKKLIIGSKLLNQPELFFIRNCCELPRQAGVMPAANEK